MSIHECECNCADCPLLCDCPCGERWKMCPVNEMVGKLNAIEGATYRSYGDLYREIDEILRGER